MTQSAAQASLDALGIQWTYGAPVGSVTYAAGLIAAQNPAAPTSMNSTDVMTLFVSLGDVSGFNLLWPWWVT